MINVSKSTIDERKFSNADDCHYLEFFISWESRSDRNSYEPESQGAAYAFHASLTLRSDFKFAQMRDQLIVVIIEILNVCEISLFEVSEYVVLNDF